MVGVAASSFTKSVWRSIRGSLGRFLAITGIVALGCGFLAGLQMSGRDMRLAADRWFDGCSLYDLRLVSTKGFSEKDVERVSSTKGVTSVMPASSADVMARIGNEQMAVRVTSLDVNAAQEAMVVSDDEIESPDVSYLNRVRLTAGRWPQAADECLLDGDAATPGLEVGDTVEVLYGTDDLDGTLSVRTFTVVGLMSSPSYPYTGTFGTTTMGDGSVKQVAYVLPSAFSDNYPRTTLYLSVDGADAALSGSPSYEDAVSAPKEALSSRLGELAQARLDDLRKEAQAKVDDAQAQLDQKREDAESQLADAKSQLDDAALQIEDGEKELASGKAQLEDGRAQLAQKRAEATSQLQEAQDQIDANQATLDQQRQELESGTATMLEQTGTSTLDEAASTLSAQKEQAGAGVAALEQQISALESLDDPANQATLDALRGQLATAQASLDQVSQALAGVEQLQTAQEQLADGQAQLDASRAQLAQERASAEAQLADAQAVLDQNAAKLAEAEDELTSSKASYEEGLASYQEQEANARSQLDDAQAEIDDAQAQVDALEQPDVFLLDRTQDEGVETYMQDTRRMDGIANVFPVFFFLVAALVALTTMTRMVEDDRVLIGTLKALGYSKGRIASRYLAYAAIASGGGAVLGIAVLSQALPAIIMASYGVIYAVPAMACPLPVDPSVALLAGGVGVGVTLVATWGAVVSSLRETPAQLMLPLAPKPGKRILLERMRPIWDRLSFSWKVTCRNLFRYKRRLAMTVAGVAGCTALLLVGFGLHDAIWDIIDCQYGPIVHYDTTVGLKDGATDGDMAAVEGILASTGQVMREDRVQEVTMHAGASSGTTDTLRVSVVVPQDASTFEGAVTLRNRITHEEIPFDDGSVVITEKLATRLGIGVGDKVVLRDVDEVGNATGEGHALTVTGVCENYVGNSVYVGREAWRSVDAADPPFSTVLVATTLGAEGRAALSEALHDEGAVSTVAFSSETIELYRSMLSVVDAVVVVLVVSAAALAFIVLYNLTNINVAERVREIASLRVLGFTRREVHAYIFREIAITAVLGDAVGLLLGTWLENFVVTTAEVDYVMFGRTIHAASYGFAFALTMAFALLVMLAMRRRLDAVDMVESLKSVD